jgi:glycosyltransferase involved in cell wall biosynthesis
VPLVSCIIPAYNSERYLAEALDSVLAQTHRPLQVIVVDDGSTDGTAALAARYGEAITLLRQPNRGVASARNCGLRRATGEFVAYLDADDLWHPEKLTRQLARFQERPEIDLSVTHFQNFWVPELVEEAKRYDGHPLAHPTWSYVFGTLLARHAFLDRVEALDEGVRQGDSLWFVHVIDQGAVLDVIPDVLMRRRFHTANMTRTEASDQMRDFARFVKARLDARRRQTRTQAP